MKIPAPLALAVGPALGATVLRALALTLHVRREEARRRLQAGLTRAAASMPVLKVDEEKWDGDRMIFRVRALGQARQRSLPRPIVNVKP